MKKIFLFAPVMLLALAGCVKDLPYSGTEPDPDPTPSGTQTLFINEVNCGTKEFEIYNSSSEAVDIAGYTFTKDDDEGTAWKVPAGKGNIPAKGFIYFTAKNDDPEEGPSFGLSGTKGFKLCMYDTKDELVDIIDNSVGVDGFQTVEDGWSLSRETDGASTWVLVEGGTMGKSNGAAPEEPGKDPGEEPGEESDAVVVLNEINGNDKYIELYNAGETEVTLNGWTIEKDGKAVWTAAELNIAANAYVVVYSNKASNVADVDASLVFNSGISAGKNVKVELKNASGEVVDSFVRGSEDIVWGDQTLPENKAASFSRVPDGVGEWAYAAPTPGAANGEKTGEIEQSEETGGEEPGGEEPGDEGAEVVVVLNEINGNDKYIELYNAGETEVTLNGWTIEKDGKAVWTAAELNIAANGYVVVYSNKASNVADVDASLVFNSGISAGKNVKVELKNAFGEVVDSFVRGAEGSGWGDEALPENKKASFSRVPDGVGEWAYAAPTPGAANGEKAGEIEQSEESGDEDAEMVVVLNEISGTDKYIELYNAGKASVTLEGWVIEKDEKSVWSGKTLTIDAGAYAVIYSDSADVVPDDENYVFSGGISGKKSVSVVLKNAAGEAVDSFVRGEKGDKWGNQDLPEEKKLSFSRVPDGVGEWAYAAPTPGAANGEKAGEIEGVNN